jgi:hypothetical protein
LQLIERGMAGEKKRRKKEKPKTDSWEKTR